MNTQRHVVDMDRPWTNEPRWKGIERPYSMADVARLRGSVHIEHTLARLGAERLWQLLNDEPFVRALGALTGNQAVQQVQAGLKAIYLSGWQVAGDANLAAQMYPDQSLYPANSVPNVVRAINNALLRADQIQHAEQKGAYLLVCADRGGRGGGIRRTAECVRADESDDRSRRRWRSLRRSASSAPRNADTWAAKCWFRREFVQKLIAARLAADVMGVPTVLIARTDADSAAVCSDADPRDGPFMTGTNARWFLPVPRWSGRRYRARPGLCALCRHDLV